uniref:hypothetical protein n=1 Tax=Alistipes sp. TaxID=1872444 RepID=UPI004056FAAF
MKKIIFLLSAILLAVVAYADGTKTCNVSGTDGSVEVSVNVTDAESGTCVITFSNDTDRNVNVRYVIYAGSGKAIPGSKLVYANSEATKQVSFGQPVNPKDVEVSELSGSRCD